MFGNKKIFAFAAFPPHPRSPKPDFRGNRVRLIRDRIGSAPSILRRLW
jgi:hypothetical protein